MIEVAKAEDIELDATYTVVLYFTADWCVPCKRFKPVLEGFDDDNEDVTIYKIDVDEHGDIADEHNVRGIPSLRVFRDGEQVNESVGAKSRDALDEIVLLA